MHQLSREQARQIAVRAQWLHRDRPSGLLERVRQLTLLQVDLTPAVAPGADRVAWSRLGSSYTSADLESALGNQGLGELAGMLRPAAVFPDDNVTPAAEALRIRAGRRLQSLGIARARGPECPVEPQDVGEVGEPAVIEGVRGSWRVDPAQLDQPFSGRAALLSPI